MFTHFFTYDAFYMWHFLLTATWHTRGHTSSLGSGAVMDGHTGIVLDYEASSKKCVKCKSVENKLKSKKIDDEKYGQWCETHKSNSKCDKNYEGPSGGMEETAAKSMWNRSLDYKSELDDFHGGWRHWAL